ncbi:MAG: response regulator [Chloroflexi bacterium]|nr:response regulator [Chloroflexota bacterium]
MIPPELHILHIEDSDLDAELVRFTLENGGIPCEIRWVDNFPAFVEELETNRYDLILADFSLPDCDGYKTLAVVREKAPQTPFVLVTGAIGEELAIDSIKAGVTDYVLKSNLVRLKTAVPRAIEEARARLGKTPGPGRSATERRAF